LTPIDTGLLQRSFSNPCKNIRNPLIFFAKNGYLLIFFACQKIINSLASKLASNFYTFDTCIIYITGYENKEFFTTYMYQLNYLFQKKLKRPGESYAF